MTQKQEEEIIKKAHEDVTIKINFNTMVTSVSSALIVAFLVWVVTSINSLQKNQIKTNDSIEEVQKSLNRLNSKK